MHFVPKYSAISYKFYEAILTQSNSALIHYNESKGEIVYSKMKILHVLSSFEWGSNLTEIRYVTNPNGTKYAYNYWDYMKAWENVL